MNQEYTWQMLNDAAKDIAEEYGIKKHEDIDEIESHLSIDYNIDQLIHQTNCHLTLGLDFEFYPYDGYNCSNHYTRKALKAFGVDPSMLREYGFKNCRKANWKRGPSVDVNEFAQCLLNTNCPAIYVAMLGGSQLRYIVEHSADIVKNGVTILTGTNVITHDFVNGASGIPFKVTRPIHFKRVHRICNDDDDHYGIQSCCGFIDSVWNGKIVEEK